jgi:hypothetical protein
MKEVRFILCIAILCSNVDFIGAQTDKTSANKENLSSFLSLGTGICPKGAVAGLACGFISSNGWGGELEFKISPFRAEKLPDDFSEGNSNLITPRDLVNVFSLKIIKDFQTSSQKFKIGIDVGPCFVQYSFVNFRLNPEYPSEFKAENKYLKDRDSKSTAGLSCSAKLKYLTGFGSLQAALFTDINNVKTVYGLELYISFSLEKSD